MNRVLYFFVKLLAMLCILAAMGYLLLYNIGLLPLIRFLYVLFFWVWGPGALFIYLGSREKTKIGFWTLSFALGIIFVSFMFAVSMFFSFSLSKTYLGPMATFLFGFFYFRKPNSLKSCVADLRCAFPIWCIGFLLACFVVVMFSLRNPSPAIVNGATAYGADFLWTVGNIEAFLRSFPPADSRISGVTFSYHYLSMVYRAALCQLSSVGSFEMSTFFYPVSNMFFLVFSLRFLALSFVRRKPSFSSFFFTTVTMMTTCASLRRNLRMPFGAYFNVFPLHTYTPTHGFELSLPFFLIVLGVICRLSVFRRAFHYSVYVLLFLLSFAATAAKGPAGLLLSISALSVLCVSVYRHMRSVSLSDSGVNTSRSFLAFFACSAGFALAYISLLSATGAAGTLEWAPGWLAWRSFPFGYPYSALFALLIPVHLAAFLPFGFLGTIAWIWSQKTTIFSTPSFAAVLTCVLFGAGGASFLRHSGMSNLYFLMFAIPCFNLLGVAWLLGRFKKLRFWQRFICSALLGLAFFSFFCTVDLYGRQGLQTRTHISLGSPIFKSTPKYGLSRDEFLALQWISENTPSNALIAGDRFWTSNERKKPVRSARYFYYSVFSKRQLYLEGWAYSKFAWQSDGIHPEIQRRLDILAIIFNDEKKSRELMMHECIDFIVVNKADHPDFRPSALKAVYENEGAVVFGVRF